MDEYSENVDDNLSTVEEEDDNDDQILSSTTTSTARAAVGAATATFELGDGLNDDDDDDDSNNDNPDLISKIINAKTPTHITLKLHVTESTCSVWETVLNNTNNILYVALPDKLGHEASKQSFISLLEFAEEKLEAAAVVLCMRKDRTDRAALVRTFLFLGFQPLNPNSELSPPQAAAALHHQAGPRVEEDEHLYLIYHIEE